MSSKEVRKWVDPFMFEAEEINEDTGPEVYLLAGNPDPLGSIAAAAKAYMGEFVGSLSEVTDAERRHYLTEIQKTALAMPLEAVQFHFRIKGVTRGFTHQMVRQRTAAYSQESTRFAVKSGVPVGRPPSLDGTLSEQEWWEAEGPIVPSNHISKEEYVERYATKEQRWRFKWDEINAQIAAFYNGVVADGMPAEDARGILPTNLLTQLNYITNLRNLQVEGGKRLCTQAQFEWRIVWAKMVEAIREYGSRQSYLKPDPNGPDHPPLLRPSAWQFEELAKIFKPVCYLEGSCPFNASFDRKCSIRSRVEQNAAANRPSTEWAKPHYVSNGDCTDEDEMRQGVYHKGWDLGIEPIHPAEWLLDPKAAR
ncbi:ThyX-like thymidylate synthase [Gordonia phage GretelLyn]|uniref:ThyX-like thymidylate synthase n=2 Tax=Lambovirus sadboi TaxID=2844674 RepID=A0A5J6TER1_9CAUD|nr:thymidylate synthase [Gordonia phage Sadboi]QFG08219.1 ThyX-like thymidylate synthase [Gordonia phage GretelLyn]QFG14732.1 ThyX-like thymidylate synthase [Gordonia phage Sadboi]